MSHKCKSTKVERNDLCVVFSGGGSEAQCQCMAGMSWNGLAVSVEEKYMIGWISFFDSVVHKECTIRLVFKMPIVIIHGFYVVKYLVVSVLVVVIIQCFGTVLCLLLVHVNIDERLINTVLLMMTIGVIIPVQLVKV